MNWKLQLQIHNYSYVNLWWRDRKCLYSIYVGSAGNGFNAFLLGFTKSLSIQRNDIVSENACSSNATWNILRNMFVEFKYGYNNLPHKGKLGALLYLFMLSAYCWCRVQRYLLQLNLNDECWAYTLEVFFQPIANFVWGGKV